MKKYLSLLLLITVACGVKQPVDTVDELDVGKIAVISEPAGAAILLDGAHTSKTTPDTLYDVPIGRHVIRVIGEGYRSIPDSLNLNLEKDQLVEARFVLQQLVTTGKIIVETAPSHAEILIDGQTTGKFSPDTVTTDAGIHRLSLAKNGYLTHSQEITVLKDSLLQVLENLKINHRILIESFGNVSCTPCVEAVANLHTFVENHDATQYAIIEYFANWPNPNDPFYKVSPQDVDQRLGYYQLQALPSMYINGIYEPDATNYTDISQKFQSAQTALKIPIGVSIERNLVDGVLQAAIEIYNPDENAVDITPFRLFAAIIENNIHYDSPPGSNGLTDFDYVFRAFLTPNIGETINSGQFNYSYTWPDWEYANCQVIAFIQNITTKQIIQMTIK